MPNSSSQWYLFICLLPRQDCQLQSLGHCFVLCFKRAWHARRLTKYWFGRILHLNVCSCSRQPTFSTDQIPCPVSQNYKRKATGSKYSVHLRLSPPPTQHVADINAALKVLRYWFSSFGAKRQIVHPYLLKIGVAIDLGLGQWMVSGRDTCHVQLEDSQSYRETLQLWSWLCSQMLKWKKQNKGCHWGNHSGEVWGPGNAGLSAWSWREEGRDWGSPQPELDVEQEAGPSFTLLGHWDFTVVTWSTSTSHTFRLI